MIATIVSLVAAVISLIAAIASLPRVEGFINWLGSRRRRSVAQINEWINSPDLNSGEKKLLHAERARRLLLSTKGISVSNLLMLEELLRVSEDEVPNGIDWNDFRLAQGYFYLNQGRLTVDFKAENYFILVSSSIVALSLFLLSFFLLFWLLLATILPIFGHTLLQITTLDPDGSRRFYMFLISASVAAFVAIPFAAPYARFQAARRVEGKLKSLREEIRPEFYG